MNDVVDVGFKNEFTVNKDTNDICYILTGVGPSTQVQIRVQVQVLKVQVPEIDYYSNTSTGAKYPCLIGTSTKV